MVDKKIDLSDPDRCALCGKKGCEHLGPRSRDGEDPFVYVDGKKEMKDGSGMIKESTPVGS
jgi:hypothetical protein